MGQGLATAQHGHHVGKDSFVQGAGVVPCRRLVLVAVIY